MVFTPPCWQESKYPNEPPRSPLQDASQQVTRYQKNPKERSPDLSGRGINPCPATGGIKYSSNNQNSPK